MAINDKGFSGFATMLLEDLVETARFNATFERLVKTHAEAARPDKTSELFNLYNAWLFRTKSEVVHSVNQHMLTEQGHTGAVRTIELTSKGLEEANKIYQITSAEVKAKYPELAEMIEHTFDRHYSG